MSWNQNQGGAYDDVLNRINGAKQANAGRDPFIKGGAHELLVCSIEVFEDRKWSTTVRGTFEILSSTNPQCQVGTTFAKLWNLKKPSKYDTQETDADNFVDFVCKAQNTQLGQHGAACTALIKTSREHPQGQLERQPARGVRIRCTGREVGKPNERGERYVAVSWASVEQNLEMIGKARAELDQRRPFFEQSHAPAQPQGGGQQFQQAPHPSQMPQGHYPAPAGTPSYANPYGAPGTNGLQPGVYPGGQPGQLAPLPAQVQQQFQPAPQMQPAPTMPAQQPQGGGFGQYVQPAGPPPGVPTGGNGGGWR